MYNQIHICVFSILLLCGRVSLLETWQAKFPGGSIFMLLGGKLGMGIADTL